MSWSPAQDVVFVHIPKTGGTSLRKSINLIDYWDYRLFDYGAKETQTSSLVKQCVYGETRVPIRSRIEDGKRLILSGHFPATKYADEFSQANFITFMRHPVMQVVSHYKHHALYNGYSGTIQSFSRSAQYRNMQSRYLDSFPISKLAFIGILEFYALDLRRLSDLMGVQIPHLHRNRLDPLNHIELRGRDIAMIESYNDKDMELYASVIAMRLSTGGTPDNS